MASGLSERRLIHAVPWDKFLEGDQAALTPEEKAGLERIHHRGMQTCHSGALLGAGLLSSAGRGIEALSGLRGPSAASGYQERADRSLKVPFSAQHRDDGP